VHENLKETTVHGKPREAAVHGRGFGKNDIKNFEKKAGVCLEFFSKLLIKCLPGRVQNPS